MVKYILIKDGLIAEYGETPSLGTGQIKVKSFSGDVGDSVDLYDASWQKIKQDEDEDEDETFTDEEKLSKGLITQEEYKTNAIRKKRGELEQIDTESLRPLRAILAGTGTDEDRTKLAELEEKANKIRAKIKELL